MTIRIMIQAPRGEFRTGYGKIAQPIANYLSKNKDYEIFYLCGAEKTFRKSTDKITYLPVKNDNWAGDFLQNNNVLFNYLTHFKIHYNLTFLDTWTGNATHLGGTHINAKTNWICHQTVNTYPVSSNIIQHSKNASWHVAPSKFVYDNLVKSGFDNVSYIPHFVDLKIFKPLNNKEELRKQFGLVKNDFVFLCVSKNNTGHKNLPNLLRAFSIFKKRNPDSVDVKLLLLTDPKDNESVSPDLGFVRYSFGLQDSVFFVWEKFNKDLKEWIPVIEGNGIPHFQSIGFSDEQMNKLYNLSDVLVLPSVGESFGLPIIEAHACGLPVIVGDHTACSELVVEGTGYVSGISDEIFNPSIHAWTKLPSTEHMAVLMEQAYKDKNKDFSKDCLKNAKKYDEKIILPKWGVLFDKMINSIPKGYGSRIGL